MESFVFKWKESSEAAQLSRTRLDHALATLRARDELDAFLVIRNDVVGYEWYRQGYNRWTPHWVASLTKSLVGGMAFLLALGDQTMSLDDPVGKYVRGWENIERKSRITLRQLITHSSGMADAMPKEDRKSWTGRFWQFPNHYRIAMEETPILFEPGAWTHYSNPGIAVFAYCLAKAFHDAGGKDIEQAVQTRIFEPLGIVQEQWGLDRDDPEDPVCREIEYYGAGEPALVNGMRVYATWGGSTFSADAVARVGRLMMHHGKWNGIQCVSERWIERALQPNGTERLFDPSVEPPMAQGLGWLLNTNKSLRQAPRDAFVGAGRGLQVLLVVPSLDLIAVRFGRYSGEDFWGEAERNFVNPVLESVL